MGVKENKTMTMIEMQAVLGNVLDQLMKEGNDRYKKEVHERAEFVAKIAKQMVNNADVILRADKLVGKTDRIDAIVGK